MTIAPPFAYVGGKQLMADTIASLMHPHDHYVEPFAGGLAVLLAKTPSSMETVNDLDGDLVNFWRVLRDHPAELARVCALTPHSRAEFTASRAPSDNPLEQARRTWIQLAQGRGGRLTRTGWRHVVTFAAGKAMPSYLDAYVERMYDAAERLRNVSLENRDALALIPKYDAPGTCFYVDPPYMPGTRRDALYRVEMSVEQHRALLSALTQCRGQVIVSGYASNLYAGALAGWHRTEVSARASTGDVRTEILWTNRAPQDILDFGNVTA